MQIQRAALRFNPPVVIRRQLPRSSLALSAVGYCARCGSTCPSIGIATAPALGRQLPPSRRLVPPRAVAWRSASTASSSGSGSEPAAPASAKPHYTADDVEEWRADFLFGRHKQHSLSEGVVGYDDDELLEWREPFDKIAKDNMISKDAFESVVTKKYAGVIAKKRLTQKIAHFWRKFDQDESGCIDFGEFIHAAWSLDVDCCKEIIRREGIEEKFSHYAEDGFMSEGHFLRLMQDFKFFAIVESDVRKMVASADLDRDGLVCLTDFLQWAEM